MKGSPVAGAVFSNLAGGDVLLTRNYAKARWTVNFNQREA
jgi:hypothetical protein